MHGLIGDRLLRRFAGELRRRSDRVPSKPQEQLEKGLRESHENAECQDTAGTHDKKEESIRETEHPTHPDEQR